MAFAPTSRYAGVGTATLTRAGATVGYLRRRFLPRGSEQPLLAQVTVAEGDRLDLIAARTLGDPEQFWRVCDANDAMDPADLEVTGRTLRVTLPQP
jgi:hypothetical protein